MDVLTEADKAATPGYFWGLVMTGLFVAVFILGRSLIRRLNNLKNRELDN